MINIKTLPIFLMALLLTIFISCQNKVKVTIDNPSNKEIKISCEKGKFKLIEPNSQKRIKLKSGQTQVFLNDSLVGTINLEPKNEYLLNPCLSDYYIEEVGYGALGTFGLRRLNNFKPVGLSEEEWEKMQQKKKEKEIPLNKVQVDSSQYFGYVIKTSDLAIKKRWKLGIKDKLPKKIKVQRYTVASSKIKIFRKSEFKKYHNLK